MLKRNGEICRAQVPDYPGRLTATEKRTYAAAIAAIESQLRDLEEAGKALAEVEKQIPRWREEAANSGAGRVLKMKTEPPAGNQWHVVKNLVKTERSELLFCARGDKGNKEFAVFEKFDPNSAYAQALGNPELILTSNNASLLLQDYVESERRMLRLVKQDLEATVEEALTEKYPGEDHSRVVKAVSARCGKCISPGRQNLHVPPPGPNVKIRF